jgi:quinoprotein dehydrogenase-associated probable ABC transporter substrate-binding protein
MSSPCRERTVLVLLVLLALAGVAFAQSPTTAPADCCDVPTTLPTSQRVIRITADANNLPFTNDKLEGVENRIAAILADELHAKVEYVWRAQRRGFFRHALKDGECDLVLAAPAGFDMGLTTKPYYRSAYAFVYRRTAALDGLKSLDDPRLKNLKVGIQLVGDDGSNAPPAHALGARGLGNNLVGYTVFGDYRDANPAARVMKGLADGEVDVAVAWGPVAGYFARKLGGDFVVQPIAEEADPLTTLPMTFDICMAVRRGNTALRDEVNAALDRRRDDVLRVLRDAGVPLLPVRELQPKRDGDD